MIQKNTKEGHEQQRQSPKSQPPKTSRKADIEPAQGEAEIKPTHAIVLQALEIASLALGRVVTLGEIVKALSAAETEQLKKEYSTEVYEGVRLILRLLIKRGIVFSPGQIGRQRYYGSAKVLDPKESPLPAPKSRRQRVLDIVNSAVAELNRAVRTGDILDHAAKRDDVSDLSPQLITHDVLSLVQTGQITQVGTIRGDEKGVNLYLPSNLDPKLYMPKEPLTWLEVVAKAYSELWEQRKTEAALENRKPRAISTSEVRARLSAAPRPHPNLDNPKLMTNAMAQLSRTGDAVVRKVERKGLNFMLWAPVDVLDEDLDVGDAYASDSERVAKALDRAVIRLGRPVTIQEIQQEIDADPFLQPAGSARLASIIADAAKETIDWNHEIRRPRVTRRVFRAGRIDGASYYYHEIAELEKAKSYVRLRQVGLAWERACFDETLSAIKSCLLPTAALGRVMLTADGTTKLLSEINDLLNHETDDATREEAEKLRTFVTKADEEVSEMLSSYSAYAKKAF